MSAKIVNRHVRLPAEIMRKVSARAKANHRSVNAEVAAILEAAVSEVAHK